MCTFRNVVQNKRWYSLSASFLLYKPFCRDQDYLRSTPIHGGGKPLVCMSYQQPAIANGLVDSIDDVRLYGMSAQCRSYFVVFTIDWYATHAMFDNDVERRYMYMSTHSFITRQHQNMLRCWCCMILSKFFGKVDHCCLSLGSPHQVMYQQR